VAITRLEEVCGKGGSLGGKNIRRHDGHIILSGSGGHSRPIGIEDRDKVISQEWKFITKSKIGNRRRTYWGQKGGLIS